MKTLNVIGCGKVGKTLARLWTRQGVFQVHSILNRTLESAQRAAEFVGSGRAVASYAELERAALVMISASDEAIADCCRQLCRTDALQPGTIVFHCSGSLWSAVLEPARARGARIASLHPVKSFAEPAAAAESFAGTFCAGEGDPAACEVLRDAVQRCGGIWFAVEPAFKTIYHAGTVFASNYLVAVVEIAVRCLQKAGVPRQTALEVLRPLVAGTCTNVFELGPVRALTGPICRGETSVVAAQGEALGAWDQGVLELYRRLGQVALDLAKAQGAAPPEALQALQQILSRQQEP